MGVFAGGIGGGEKIESVQEVDPSLTGLEIARILLASDEEAGSFINDRFDQFGDYDNDKAIKAFARLPEEQLAFYTTLTAGISAFRAREREEKEAAEAEVIKDKGSDFKNLFEAYYPRLLERGVASSVGEPVLIGDTEMVTFGNSGRVLAHAQYDSLAERWAFTAIDARVRDIQVFFDQDLENPNSSSPEQLLDDLAILHKVVASTAKERNLAKVEQ